MNSLFIPSLVHISTSNITIIVFVELALADSSLI